MDPLILKKLAEEREREEEKFKIALEKIENYINSELTTESERILNSIESLKREVESKKKERELLIPVFESLKSLATLQRIVSTLLLENLRTILPMIDAKEKEWDALGSNHVGILFDSLNWKIDSLKIQKEKIEGIIETFISIKKEIEEFSNLLKKKDVPSESFEWLEKRFDDLGYRFFEAAFRGWEEEIKERQKIYLKYFIGKNNIIDFGCGRGEFLELLRENNIEGYGIEINEEMVRICKEKGLKCINEDIVYHLSKLEDESLNGFFSSQVVEHIEPTLMRKIFDILYFKLSNGSFAILETVNPTSLYTLSEVYWRDPTHKNPIHPETLKFLLETSGFRVEEIKFLSPTKEELKEIPEDNDLLRRISYNFKLLKKIIFGYQDYAIIAKRP
ncbi:MAG: class I SAM-dependent methyltransferase [Candidatus Aminicenantia bacterium]